MNFLRKSALVIITPLFSLLLFATAIDMGVLRVAGQPTEVKKILRDSGVYDSAVNNLLSQSKQLTTDGANIDLTNPTVQAAANKVFTPQYVQGQSEDFIDSVYAWLDGKTAQPDFRVDLSSLKGQFAANVSQAVEQRAQGLPRCTDAASSAAAVSDPVAAACLPSGVTPAAVASEVQGDVLSGQGFLDDQVLTAGSLKDSNTNRPVFSDQLKDAPQQYRKFKRAPVVLAILTLLVAVAIVLLSASRRRGLRHVGIVLVLIGLFMMLLAWGVGRVVNQDVVPKIKLDNAVLQNDVRKVVSDVTQQIDRNYWIFGGVYAVLGVLALAAAEFWPRGPQEKADLKGEGRNADDRIDLRAPDKAADVDSMEKAVAEDPAKAKAKKAAKTPAKGSNPKT